jgi:hypothetical protein
MRGWASTTHAARASEFRREEVVARVSCGGVVAYINHAPSPTPYIYRAC